SLVEVGKILQSAFSNATLTCKATSRKLTAGAIVVICLLSVFALLAVIGSFITALEYYMKVKFSQAREYDFSAPGKLVNSVDAERRLMM
ncbi:hypothetical protein AVEN_14317-1, partial [Araneus ventricosus]